MYEELFVAWRAAPKSGPRSGPQLNGIAWDRELPEPHTASTAIRSP